MLHPLRLAHYTCHKYDHDQAPPAAIANSPSATTGFGFPFGAYVIPSLLIAHPLLKFFSQNNHQAQIYQLDDNPSFLNKTS